MLTAIDSLKNDINHLKAQLDNLSNNRMQRHSSCSQSGPVKDKANPGIGDADDNIAPAVEEDCPQQEHDEDPSESQTEQNPDASVISIEQEMAESELTDYLN